MYAPRMDVFESSGNAGYIKDNGWALDCAEIGRSFRWAIRHINIFISRMDTRQELLPMLMDGFEQFFGH